MFRPNSTCVCCDITKISQLDLYTKHNVPSVIDYISIDVDSLSLYALMTFPFDKYSFKFLTIEHDFYVNKDHNIKKAYKEILEPKGYRLFADDVGLANTTQNWLEDWYINKAYYKDFLVNDVEDIYYLKQNPNDIMFDLIKKSKIYGK